MATPPNEARDGTGRPAKELPRSWAESRRFVPRAFVQPVLGFMRTEASGGVVMLLAAVAALVWANSPGADSYFDLFATRVELGFGDFHFQHLSELTIREWVNDGLMVVFFFVVGLEIKRELVEGELRDPRAAALPAFGALGGMMVPALIFLAFTAGDADASRGWGVPVATDIAFAVGVVSLVGRRVPVGAKLFLLALAIVDDIGGILIIALFYTEQLSIAWLAAALAGLGLVQAMKLADVRPVAAYVVVGTFVWLCLLESGVHATLAGVTLGLMTPTAPFYDPERFPDRASNLIAKVGSYVGRDGPDHHTLERMESLMHDLRRLSRESMPPLDRLEHVVAPYSSFVVVPVFALANAGVRLSGDTVGGVATSPVFLGIALGLVVGKVVGVVGMSWVAIRLGLGRMPRGATWRHMVGMGLLAGIGFTVALFIASLAYGGSQFADLLADAKIGIFAASLVAGVLGFLWLRAIPEPDAPRSRPPREGDQETVALHA